MNRQSPFFAHTLATLDGLKIASGTARIVEQDGANALELQGLALIPDLVPKDAGIDVEILAPAPCYPGVAFRIADPGNFELAYVVPAASGQSDAIQYDPVFNGSNTWQLHTGPAFQQRAVVPVGEWVSVRVDVAGDRAVIRLGDQPPLVVERLTRQVTEGRIGLWTYRPARFRNLHVRPPRHFDGVAGQKAQAPQGVIDRWPMEGFGVVTVEQSGVLNLNRYMTSSDTEAHLTRWFDVGAETDLEVSFGFSDSLRLFVDDIPVFRGTHTFSGFQDVRSRGWVRAENCRVIHRVGPGRHRLDALLRVTEPFGWGLIVVLGGDHLALLPPTDRSEPNREP